ncbi:hypothetical protein Tco_1228337 [Tanacetum coccineum]
MMRVTTSFLQGKWQHQIMNEKSHFHCGNSKKVTKIKILGKGVPEPAKAGKEAGSVYPPHEDSQRNFGFRKCKIQSPAIDDDSGQKAKPCQNIGKEQPKAAKKGETSGKDKALAILMVQPLERVARQKITQSFSPNTKIFFPSLDEDDGNR